MRLAVVAIAVGLLVGCGQPAADPASESNPRNEVDEQVALERSRKAADALGAELMSTMAAEMARGGPAAAIVVCSEVAQSIANEHSQDGLAVRRVTLKARNSLNQPDAYERAALERLQSLHDRGELPTEIFEVVEHDGSRVLRYIRPIQTAELCLACHGDANALAPEVRQVILERYPNDAATGYSAGQLRGAISVQTRLQP